MLVPGSCCLTYVFGVHYNCPGCWNWAELWCLALNAGTGSGAKLRGFILIQIPGDNTVHLFEVFCFHPALGLIALKSCKGFSRWFLLIIHCTSNTVVSFRWCSAAFLEVEHWSGIYFEETAVIREFLVVVNLGFTPLRSPCLSSLLSRPDTALVATFPSLSQCYLWRLPYLWYPEK